MGESDVEPLLSPLEYRPPPCGEGKWLPHSGQLGPRAQSWSHKGSEYNLPGKVFDWLCLDQSQGPGVRNIVIGWPGSHGHPIPRRGVVQLAAPPELQTIGVQFPKEKVCFPRGCRRAGSIGRQKQQSFNELLSLRGVGGLGAAHLVGLCPRRGCRATEVLTNLLFPITSSRDHRLHFTNAVSQRRVDGCAITTIQI